MKSLIAAAITLCTTPAMAQCEADYIQSVSDSGEVIVLESGHVFQVDSGDKVESMIWLPADHVLICGGEIIDTDENGEKVGVTQLK
jgi:hypothetical protein